MKDGWIAVDKELPDRFDAVLVCYRTYDNVAKTFGELLVGVGHLAEEDQEPRKWVVETEVEDDPEIYPMVVLAWKELPPPPKDLERHMVLTPVKGGKA